MKARKYAAAAVVAALIVVVVAAGYLYQPGQQQKSTSSTTTACLPLGGTSVLRSTAGKTSFGAVTEYSLPQPLRWPNGAAAASDGSLWFGEGSVPGVAHLMRNGTLVEYPWPTAGRPATGSCGYRTGIWGVRLWNGLVWGADADENALVGIDPATGKATVVNTSAGAGFPYSLSVSPDGSLWFTAESATAVLGRVSPNLTLSVLPVSGLGGEFPLQVSFVNASYAYFVGIDPYNPPYGHLYSFDPRASAASVAPTKVGGAFRVVEPTSVSASAGRVWVTQHGTSSVAAFDPAEGNWTVYPTSLTDFAAHNPTATLPYFVEAEGGAVWFNEHYANRMALLNATAGTLTEFSEADPPITDGTQIQNDLTIAATAGGSWFTSATGNYVGFVSGTVHPSFSLSLDGPQSGSAPPGGSVALKLTVSGSWASSLRLGFSDSENLSGASSAIRMAPSGGVIAAGSGPLTLNVQISASAGLQPGPYTLAVSASDGLVTQTAYYFLRVT